MGIYLQIIEVLKCGSQLKRTWMQFVLQYCTHKVIQQKHSHVRRHSCWQEAQVSHFLRLWERSSEKSLLAGTQEWPLDGLDWFKYPVDQLTR